MCVVSSFRWAEVHYYNHSDCNLRVYFVEFLQAANLTISDIDPALKERLQKFRFRKEKNNAAIISKSQPLLCQDLVMQTGPPLIGWSGV